jgi:energy-coupling factor transporter transmembrane protein EcfT
MYWFVVVVLTVTLGSDPIFMFLLLLSVLFVVHASKIPMSNIASFLKSVWPVAAVYGIFNLLFPSTVSTIKNPWVLFYAIPPSMLPVSLEGVVWMFGALLRFLILLLIIRTVLMITPIRDLILAFVKFRVPPEFAMALSIGFAYVPVLIDENQKIKEAQQARGFEYEYRNPLKRLNALIRRMFVPSIFNSMRRTSDISIAIESRGFGHDLSHRTYMHELHFTQEDYAFLTFMIIVMVVAVAIGNWGLNWVTYTNTVTLLKHMFGRI